MELQPISGLTLRRALLGTLLAAGRPMTVGEVVLALHSAGVTTWQGTAKPVHQVIADMLAYQVRAGRVERVARGVYRVIPASISRSTQRRCRLWSDRLAPPADHG